MGRMSLPPLPISLESHEKFHNLEPTSKHFLAAFKTKTFPDPLSHPPTRPFAVLFNVEFLPWTSLADEEGP